MILTEGNSAYALDHPLLFLITSSYADGFSFFTFLALFNVVSETPANLANSAFSFTGVFTFLPIGSTELFGKKKA